jgi:hypothetical protein
MASCMSWSCLAVTTNGYMPWGNVGNRDMYPDSRIEYSGTRLCATAIAMGMIMVVPFRLPLIKSGYIWAIGFGWSTLVLVFCADRPVSNVDASSNTANAVDPIIVDMMGLLDLEETAGTVLATD